MSNQELFNFYTKILENWNDLFYQYNQIKNKDFVNIKKCFHHIDKGEYIVIEFQNIRAIIYNDHGIAKLDEPFGIQIGNRIQYHMSTYMIENHLRCLYH